MHVVAIIQARMGSTRLPGKVLLDLAGAPVLTRVVNRCRRAAMLNDVVVATTTQAADDPIVELCWANKWTSFRGQEDDVLDRYYRAALQNRAEVVVRITSDCPLIEPEITDLTVETFLQDGSMDYVGNSLPPEPSPGGWM